MRGYRRQTPPRLGRATLVLLLYSTLSLVAVAIAYGRGALDLYRPVGNSTAQWLMLSPALGIGVGLAVVVISRLLVRYFDWAKLLHTSFRDLLGQLSGREIVVLAVASAIGEELLFRGALLPWVGLWAQAVIFALLHIGPGVRFLPWTGLALLMGLLFGWLVQLTGDLGAPIAAHFTINFLNLHYISRTELPGPESESGSEPESETESEAEAEAAPEPAPEPVAP